jgi:hypothetical protein
MNCLPRMDFIQNYITANLFGVRENAHQILHWVGGQIWNTDLS